jgi:hypothetical protein
MPLAPQICNDMIRFPREVVLVSREVMRAFKELMRASTDVIFSTTWTNIFVMRVRSAVEFAIIGVRTATKGEARAKT